METKIIRPQWWNPENIHQPSKRISTPGLDQDVGSLRLQLEKIIKFGDNESHTDASTNSNDKILKSVLKILYTNKPQIRKNFTEVAAKQAFDIFKTTWGKEETAVWIYANEIDEESIIFGKVIELNSAQRWAESVSYNPEELLEGEEWMTTVWGGHNHLIGKDIIKMKNWETTSVQWKSDTDINSDKNLNDQVKNSWDIKENHFTSMLSMPYEHEWELYRTVAITGLTSWKGDRETFKYGWKICHQLIQLPDWSIKDIMDVSQELAARILHNRLMGMEHDEENVKIAA